MFCFVRETSRDFDLQVPDRVTYRIGRQLFDWRILNDSNCDWGELKKKRNLKEIKRELIRKSIELKPREKYVHPHSDSISESDGLMGGDDDADDLDARTSHLLQADDTPNDHLHVSDGRKRYRPDKPELMEELHVKNNSNQYVTSLTESRFPVSSALEDAIQLLLQKCNIKPSIESAYANLDQWFSFVDLSNNERAILAHQFKMRDLYDIFTIDVDDLIQVGISKQSAKRWVHQASKFQ